MNSLVISNLEKRESREFKVTEKDALKCWNIRRRLVKALDLEIIYDQIIESYWDYKNKVNYWNLRSVSMPSSDYLLNHEIRSSLNRLAFNVLNISKLYLDLHFNKSKKSCFASDITDDDDLKLIVDSQRNEIYQSNLHYVVGCKLRAYSQHRALPVFRFTTGVRYEHPTQKKVSDFNIYYGHKELTDMDVPVERVSKDVKLDLTDIIDGYIFAIAQMHALNRKLSNSIVSKSCIEYISMWEKEIQQAGFKEYICKLCTCNHEPLYISLEWFDVYDYLKSKHHLPINYSEIIFEK